LDRFLDAETHPADLLHKELAAPGSALVMRQDIADLSVGQDINQEGLAAQRCNGVKITPHLAKRPLNSCNLGDMAPTAGHSEIFCIPELRSGKDALENFEGTTLVWHDLGT
jgi:hypothetical protein